MKNTTIIKLDDEFTVQSDPHCWILIRVSFGNINPKTGKPKRSVATLYFPNLKTALAEYLDWSLKGSSEVRELFTRLCDAEHKIELALKVVRGHRIGSSSVKQVSASPR